jgi:hypothetical protein
MRLDNENDINYGTLQSRINNLTWPLHQWYPSVRICNSKIGEHILMKFVVDIRLFETSVKSHILIS